jgi:hypothetical protein
MPGPNDEKRKMLAMSAAMEGNAAIVRSIGAPKKVSEMELIVLCNFARIGLLSVFAELEGKAGDAADRELEQLIEAVRETFARKGCSDGRSDGLMRLSQSCAALLGGERFGKYVAA